jgi:hypothetical protein
MPIDRVGELAARAGLDLCGAFAPAVEDWVGPRACGAVPGTIVLLGWAGSSGWPRFAASPEFRDGLSDPLDRWSRRVIDEMAAQCGAIAIYPFEGPPWPPFQTWARRAGGGFVSPLGLLIHPDYGLWQSYRGALAFQEKLDPPLANARAHPCESCADRPCLSACPVGAFSAAGYDVDACAAHLAAPDGEPCMRAGCRARLACPIGAEHRYGAQQARFYMGAFRAGRERAAGH